MRRVALALWSLGGLGGALPEDAFEYPILAADFAQTAYWNLGSTYAEPLTVYFGGRFDGEGRLANSARGDGVSDADRRILGATKVIGDAWAAAEADAEQPLWTRLAFSIKRATFPNAYRFVETSTPSLTIGSVKGALNSYLTRAGADLRGARASAPGAPQLVRLDAARQQSFMEAFARANWSSRGLNYCSSPAAPDRSYIQFLPDEKSLLVAGVANNGATDLDGMTAIPGVNFGDPVTLFAPIDSLQLVPLGVEAACSSGQTGLGVVGRAKLRPNCASVFWSDFSGPNVMAWAPALALRPETCSPAERSRYFVAEGSIVNPASAALRLMRAVRLACEFGTKANRVRRQPTEFPKVTSPKDLPKYEDWIRGERERTRQLLVSLVLRSVPERVVTDFQQGRVGSGSVEGLKGQQFLQYEQGVLDIVQTWGAIEGDLQALADAVGVAAIDLVGVDFSNQVELSRIAMERVGLQATRAKGAIAVATGIIDVVNPTGALTGGTGDAIEKGASGAVDVWSSSTQLSILDDVEAVTKAAAANDVARVLATLGQTVNPTFTSLQGSIERLKGGVAAVTSTGSALRQSEREAKYQLAKGAGADFVRIGDDVVPLPVNTALRRQYDLTRKRYERALNDAKYMAYLARLAIEQRIGMRLDQMDQAVGTLPPPRTWADDICSFQGIDYRRFRGAVITDSDGGVLVEGGITDGQFFGEDPNDATKFASPYIGDYVDRLQAFVEFYNVEYPAQEGTDTAVISLRDDLVAANASCSRDSRNLLFFSHDLTAADGAAPDIVGWQRRTCDASNFGGACMFVSDGAKLPGSASYPTNPALLGLPAQAGPSGATWLREEVPLPNGDGGVPPSVDGGVGVEVGPIPGTVFQRVSLSANSKYVLSWWDLARAVNGMPGPSPSYRVAVYDASWNVVVSASPAPYDPAVAQADLYRFSSVLDDRRRIAFNAPASGHYYVVFGASVNGVRGGTPGSVVIANVQLEETFGSEEPTAYEGTGATRAVVSGDCPKLSPAEFRSAFRQACDGPECYWELDRPLIVDSVAIRSSLSRLAGKVARGNFNYRHVDLALNVVGSGVLDCTTSQTPSCFGTGFTEYDLVHSSFYVPIVNHVSVPQYFNFGQGAVRHGKALTAERFLTAPLGSADQSLLGQPAFTKTELRGRPIDGSYRLRIYQKPSLVWDRVEDIQLLMNYRYWSRVERSQ